ncbi:MAG TPA: hypothetical protein VFE53_11050 [Mucilaginibacter sp.]|jgi:hypothetical protein|nr:hypothetical protein [Mucilaginibacter sp.]
MKKDKQQSPAKAARKAIQESLIKTLKTIASQLQKQGIHTDIDVEKESKKLAKKITKGAKVDQPAAPAAHKESPAAAEAKAPAKEAAPVKAKPAAKSPEPKVEKAAAPVAVPKAPVSAATASKNGRPVAKKAAEKK